MLILEVNHGDIVRVGRDVVITVVAARGHTKLGLECDPGLQVTRNKSEASHLAAQLERERRLGLEACETCDVVPPARIAGGS